MKAFIKNYRQSPRKVRLVADVIRGKEVPYALSMLNFLQRRAATPLKKLLESAVANAKHSGIKNIEKLVIKEISVDKGLIFKRLEYRARGSANSLKKRTSHISIVLGENTGGHKTDHPKPHTNAKAESAV
ncbi:MAG TPA: 50S ribosomal protein L22 [Candidatus Paceibacterota bacterium]